MLTSLHQHSGAALARLAALLIFCDIALMAGVGIWVFSVAGTKIPAIGTMFTSTSLPILIYAGWTLAIFGTVAAIASVVLYGYRERWFWRCLLVGSFVWIAFPPVHFVIGLVAFVILLRSREKFPITQDVRDSTP